MLSDQITIEKELSNSIEVKALCNVSLVEDYPSKRKLIELNFVEVLAIRITWRWYPVSTPFRKKLARWIEKEYFDEMYEYIIDHYDINNIFYED